MGRIAFLLIAFVQISAIYGAPLAGPIFVPDCTSLHGAENYPNLKQLNTYYQCVHGSPVLLYCPSRQEFNAAKGTCEPLRSISSYPDVDKTGIKCTYEGEFLCNPLNPKSFYQCSAGIPHLHDCPGGLNFDINLKTCNWPSQQTGCALQCTFEGQYISNPDNPQSFYQCSHGRPILHHCPADLIFNMDINVCDYPGTQDHNISPCMGIDGIEHMLPDLATDCEFYFRYDKIGENCGLKKCMDGRRFSPHTLECDLPSNVCAPCGTRRC